MEIIESTDLRLIQKEEIFRLWNQEYPENLKYRELADFEKYLAGLKDCKHYLAVQDGSVIGWCCLFRRDNEHWFAIILDHQIQGKGLGTTLLDKLKATVDKLNGWVIDHNRDFKSNGAPYRSPLNFYLKNGFKIIPDIRLEFANISAVKIVWDRE